VYGIGGNNTHAVIEEIHYTNLKGVSALLSVSPYYNKPSQEGIYQHFKKVADTSPLPILLYNVPGRTGSNLTADTTLRLAQHTNIIGIKEASGSVEQCLKIAKEKPKDFLLISGDDMFTVPLYSIGGAGVISVLANAYPLIFKKMTEHAKAGNFAKASSEVFKLLEINGPMYEEGNPTGLKYLMSLMNLCGPYYRLPLVEPSAALKKKIEKAFAKITG
jgi:4-hydroxy-tetrahydrodipicolinate synthase